MNQITEIFSCYIFIHLKLRYYTCAIYANEIQLLGFRLYNKHTYCNSIHLNRLDNHYARHIYSCNSHRDCWHIGSLEERNLKAKIITTCKSGIPFIFVLITVMLKLRQNIQKTKCTEYFLRQVGNVPIIIFSSCRSTLIFHLEKMEGINYHKCPSDDLKDAFRNSIIQGAATRLNEYNSLIGLSI